MFSALSFSISSTSEFVSDMSADHTSPAMPLTIGVEKEVPDQYV